MNKFHSHIYINSNNIVLYDKLIVFRDLERNVDSILY
jgi:hypothetical protein